MNKISCALVLSGGGALGAAHIGVLQHLEENGYTINYLAGVSAGSIVAGLIAAGYKSDVASEVSKKSNIFKSIFDFTPSNFGILKGKNITKVLTEFYKDKRIEDCDMPLVIGTTDFQTGERVMIRTGKIVDAVRASISVPGIFEPYFHPELKRWLVDGGLTQNFPLDTAIEEYKGSTIIGSDVASGLSKNMDLTETSFFGKPKRITRSIFQTFRIIFKSQQAHFEKDDRVTIIQPDVEKFNSFDIFDLPPIIEAGRVAATSITAN